MSKEETLLSFILYRSLLLGRTKVWEIVERAVVILKETSMPRSRDLNGERVASQL